MLTLKQEKRAPHWMGRQLREMIRMRNDGASMSEIGRQFGVTRQAVSIALKRYAVEGETDHVSVLQQ